MKQEKEFNISNAHAWFLEMGDRPANVVLNRYFTHPVHSKVMEKMTDKEITEYIYEQEMLKPLLNAKI